MRFGEPIMATYSSLDACARWPITHEVAETPCEDEEQIQQDRPLAQLSPVMSPAAP